MWKVLLGIGAALTALKVTNDIFDALENRPNSIYMAAFILIFLVIFISAIWLWSTDRHRWVGLIAFGVCVSMLFAAWWASPPKTFMEDDFVVAVFDFHCTPGGKDGYALGPAIAARLRAQLISEYDDVVIASIPEAFSEHGATEVKEMAKRRNVDVAIWGWYTTEGDDIDVLSFNFDVLNASRAFLDFGDTTRGDPIFFPESQQEHFQIRMGLLSDITYLTTVAAGVVNYLKGDWGGAREKLSSAIEGNEASILSIDRSIALFYRARAYRKLENLDACIGDYRAAVQLNPQFYRAFGNLGEALAANKKWNAALGAFENAIELISRPNGEKKSAETCMHLAVCRHNRATIFQLLGRTFEAIDESRNAVMLAEQGRDAVSNQDTTTIYIIAVNGLGNALLTRAIDYDDTEITIEATEYLAEAVVEIEWQLEINEFVLGNYRGAAICLNLAKALHYASQDIKAVSHVEKSLSFLDSTNESGNELKLQELRGSAFLLRGGLIRGSRSDLMLADELFSGVYNSNQDRHVLARLVECRRIQARRLSDSQNVNESLDMFRSAVDLCEAREIKKENFRLRAACADAYYDFGNELRKSATPESAFKPLADAVEMFRALGKDSRRFYYDDRLINALIGEAFLYEITGDWEALCDRIAEADQILATLGDSEKDSDRGVALAGLIRFNTGDCLRSSPEAALDAYNAGIVRIERLLRKGRIRHSRKYVAMVEQRAEYLAKVGHAKRAVESLDSAIALIRDFDVPVIRQQQMIDKFEHLRVSFERELE